MTIRLSWKDFFVESVNVSSEEPQRDPSDELDITYNFDTKISSGWRRKIILRQDLLLMSDCHQLADQLELVEPKERMYSYINCSFMLSGKGISSEFDFSFKSGQYELNTNGMCPSSISRYEDIEPISYLEIAVKPETLRSFIASSKGELPKNLQHLIISPGEPVYFRSGDTQPMMNTVIQQILRCPYRGMIKRIYLESKAIELVALVLDDEITIQQGEVEKSTLKPEQQERICYAKEILLRDMINPPSLSELAQQAGLNEFTLKQGFRQMFGTTVFGELRSHRLDIAKHLLAEQNISVAEVAAIVGYGSATALARSFRREFGISPKEYQKACR